MGAAGTIRVGGIVAFIKVIRDLGYDPESIILSVGLNPELLEDPDFVVPASIFGKLFAHCVKVTGCDYFGMRVGQEGSLAWLGRLGFLARNSTNVGLALHVIADHYRYHDRSAIVAINQSGHLARLRYLPLFAWEGQEQWLSGTMSFGVKMMRELCGANWAPEEVTFTRSRPADTRPYERFFRSKLRFEAAETALLFNASWLEHSIYDAQPELRRLLQKDINQENDSHREDFPRDVMRLVLTHIGVGDCSTTKLSALLGVSPRALSNKLSVSGTSFKQLLDTARFEVAKQLLQNTSMTLADISWKLDYSEVSAFNRAFSRWCGTPPGDWRRNNRAQ